MELTIHFGLDFRPARPVAVEMLHAVGIANTNSKYFGYTAFIPPSPPSAYFHMHSPFGRKPVVYANHNVPFKKVLPQLGHLYHPHKILNNRVGHLGRFKSLTDTSSRLCIMSTTRQSEHILIRSRFPANAPCRASLPTMFSIICSVPNGLLQRMQ